MRATKRRADVGTPAQLRRFAEGKFVWREGRMWALLVNCAPFPQVLLRAFIARFWG
jgi:hypothetical protein